MNKMNRKSHGISSAKAITNAMRSFAALCYVMSCYAIPLHPILSDPILSYSTPSYPLINFLPALSYPIWSYALYSIVFRVVLLWSIDCSVALIIIYSLILLHEKCLQFD